MRPDLGPLKARATERGGWQSMAFLIEAVLLLVFLAACVAVFTQMFAYAAERSAEADVLARAVVAADNAAEAFAANPAATPEPVQTDDLRVEVQVDPQAHAAGTLYRATVSVFAQSQDAPVYTLETAHYTPDTTGVSAHG